MRTLRDKTAVSSKFTIEPDDGKIICRCEEITKGEIRKAVQDGMYTVTEVRRYLRSGMGLCQGQTCGKLVKAIIAKERNIPLDKVESAESRAPMRPIEMRIFGDEGGVDYE